ncbi:MAG: hypothetical protein GX555_17650 [Actinomycetales bacterium]|nr:hypothetical protein [Actinomycetales bacterium]
MSGVELEERGSGPKALDIPIVLICAAVDLFVSGYFSGDRFETIFGTVLPHWPTVALIALGYGVLAWRRAAPWLTFLVILGIGLVGGVLLTLFQPIVGVALALYAVARRSPARRANPALVLAAFLSLNNARTATGVTDESGLFGLVVIACIFMAVLTVVWALGRRERRTRFRAAEEQQRLMTSAEESLGQQRQQIARDLHDILSHSMSAMILQSAGAKAVSSKLDSTSEAKQVTEALAAIESTGAESMRELHRLLGLLRTQDSDQGTVARLSLADVGPLITATRHGGLIVQHHREGTPAALDPSVDLAAYHMVQESLTNAMKHAGRGAVVDIYETWEPGELTLQVRSARGLTEGAAPSVATPGSGTGLWGLRERVELAGGSFESGRVEGGFVTAAVLPVRTGTPPPGSADTPVTDATIEIPDDAPSTTGGETPHTSPAGDAPTGGDAPEASSRHTTITPATTSPGDGEASTSTDSKGGS